MAKRITLSTGVTLDYVEQGDPAGVPVICLHGWPDSRRSYETMLAHMPASLRVIVPSLRGFGASTCPTGGYQPADFAQDVRALLDALGLMRAVIVGHSMGSVIALRLAIDHPERVAGLGLIGALTGLKGHALAQEMWEQAISGFAHPIDPGFVREFQESTLTQPVPAGFVDMIVAESLKAPAEVWRDAFAGMLAEDLSDALDAIMAPTFLMWGDQDGLADRETQELLASAIPGASLAIYRGCGHSVQWERPDRIAADITAFVTASVGLETARRTRRNAA